LHVSNIRSTEELIAIAARGLGAPVVEFAEHQSAFGSSRKAYAARTARSRAFLRCAVPGLGLESTMFSLAREAEILRALASVGLPVPAPLLASDEGDVVVLEWLDGDVGPRGDRLERVHLAHSYVTAILALADVDAARVFPTESASAPTIATAVDVELRRWRGIATPDFLADPLGAALLAWLDANRTRDASPSAVVHADAGHGNFLVLGERITGLVDWELSHLGDPLEDIACMQMRSLSRDPAVWFDAVRAACAERGLVPDRARLGWERVHVLVRSAIAMRRSLSQGNEGRPHAPFARYETENLLLALWEAAKLGTSGAAPPPDDLAALLREATRRCMPDGVPSMRTVDAGYAFAYPEVER
jgi:aminoglycoside phosphotransferase (APT) family kinase protein